MEDKLSTVARYKRDQSSLDQDIADLGNKFAALQVELESTTAEDVSASEEIKQKEANILAERKEIADLEAVIKVYAAEMAEAMQQARADIEILKAEELTQLAKISELKANIKTKEAEKAELTARLGDLNAERNDVEAELEKLILKMSELQVFEFWV